MLSNQRAVRGFEWKNPCYAALLFDFRAVFKPKTHGRNLTLEFLKGTSEYLRA